MIILYFYDNVIQYKEKEETNQYQLLKEAMQYGKIKNIPMFESELEKLAKKEKWITLFNSKKINIILPNFYTETDREILTVIFHNIGIKNIKLKRENSLLDLKKNNILINIHKDYLVQTVKTKNALNTQVFPYYIFGNIEKTLEYLLEKHKEKRFILIGSLEVIPKIVEKKKVPNVYYYNNYKTYIIDLYTL